MKKKFGNKGEKEIKEKWWRPSLIMFGRLSVWIGTPVLIALFIGNWLDDKFETKPFIFLFSIGIAFLVSSFGIVLEAQKSLKEIDVQEIQKVQKDNVKKGKDQAEKRILKD